MRTKFKFRLEAVLLFAAAVLLAACTSFPVGEYSLQAYENATTLKAEALGMVARSGQPFAANREAVEALTIRIDAAYEFAAGMPNNTISAEQWREMRDPNANLYGGFVRYWQKRGTLKPDFRSQYAQQLSEAFNYIICLEANKQASTSCTASASSGG